MAQIMTPHRHLRFAQGVLLCAAASGVTLVALRSTPSAVDVPKVTALWVTGIALAAVALLWIAATGHDPVRGRSPERRVVTAAAVFFIGAMILATVNSPYPQISVTGYYARHTGLLFYLALLIVWWTAAQLEGIWRRCCLHVVVVTASAVMIYGFLQWVGLPQVKWGGEFTGIYGTLGQPNYFSAYSAIVAPLSLWGVLSGGSIWLRGISALVALSVIPVLIGTDSSQGFAALAAAGIVMGGAYLFAEGGVHWNRRRAVATAAIILTALSAGAVLGPRLLATGLSERRYIYESGLSMLDGHLLLGRGLDLFGILFLRHRPIEHAQAHGTQTIDAAHNVPLHLAVGGGLLLLAAYLSFVLATGWLLYRLLRKSGRDWQVLALAGSWSAYHVQSLVSIENAPVALFHYMIAGFILAKWEQAEDVPLKGRGGSAKGRTRRSREATKAPQRTVPTGIRVVAGASFAATIAVGLTWAAWPLRAEFATVAAADAASRGDLPGAIEQLELAHELAPHVGDYYLVHSRLLLQGDETQAAYEAVVRGADQDPGYSTYSATAAVLAERLGRVDDAERWFEMALDIDPYNPEVLAEAARFFADHGEQVRAQMFLERAQEVSSSAEN